MPWPNLSLEALKQKKANINNRHNNDTNGDDGKLLS